MSKSNAGRIGVWGASGSGKSSYVKQLIKNRPRTVFFDPLDEYGPLAKTKVTTLEGVRAAMRKDFGGFRIAYVPPAGQEARCLSALCRLLILAQEPFRTAGKGGHVTLVVEELNLSFPVAGGAEKCSGFAEVCSRGRHSGIEVYGLSQRIAEVSTRFRGNCTKTVVLRQQGPRDIAAATDALGAAKGRVGQLRNLQYLVGDAGEITEGTITFPKKRTAKRKS